MRYVYVNHNPFYGEDWECPLAQVRIIKHGKKYCFNCGVIMRISKQDKYYCSRFCWRSK